MKAMRFAGPVLGLCLLCCNSPGGRHGGPGQAPGGPAAVLQAGPQRLELVATSGEVQVTIRLEGAERQVVLPDGKGTFTGRPKEKHPDKTLYQSAAGGSYEIKEGDAGFKLRDVQGKLLWKVKLHEEKVKISDNEAGERAFELTPREGGRIKLKRDDKELGKAECRPGKVKIEDEAGQDRFSSKTDRCTGVGTLLLVGEMAPVERALLMAELWARGR